MACVVGNFIFTVWEKGDNMGGSMVGSSGGHSPQKTYNRIKELLEKNGYDTSNQEKIGDAVNVSRSSVQRWQNNFPKMDDLIFISQKFGVSLDWLVFGKEENKKDSPAETAEKPIEEYTAKDFARILVALSDIGKVDFSADRTIKNDRSSLAPIYTICFTPRETVKIQNYQIDEDIHLDVAIHYIDNRFDEIFYFLENRQQIALYFGGFASELPPRYQFSNFENNIFPKELSETKIFTSFSNELEKMETDAAIDAINQYSKPHEGNTPLGIAKESNIEIVVESCTAYDERLGYEFSSNIK